MAPKARTAFQCSAEDLKFFEAKFGEKLPVVLPTLRFGAQLFRAAKTSVDNFAIQQALDKLDRRLAGAHRVQSVGASTPLAHRACRFHHRHADRLPRT